MIYAPDPTPGDLEDPFFEAIWQAIKDWGIQRGPSVGYARATGTDVIRVLTAVRATAAEVKAKGGSLTG